MENTQREPAMLLKEQIAVSFSATYTGMAQDAVERLIGEAYNACMAMYPDLPGYVPDMLTAGLLPDWTRLQPQGYIEALYTICRVSPQIQQRNQARALEAGAQCPLGLMKVFMQYEYREAYPQFTWDEAGELVELAFADILRRFPDFEAKISGLYLIWNAVKPDFKACSMTEFLEILMIVSRHASFLREEPELATLAVGSTIQ